MDLPYLTATSLQESVISQFVGYDHEDRIQEGAFYDTQNLTSDQYPMMAVRKKRGVYRTGVTVNGALGKAQLAWVDGNHLWYGVEDITATYLTAAGLSLSSGKKQLVSMGAYIIVLPDGIWFNTEDPTDIGKIAQNVSKTGVKITPCLADGSSFSYITGPDAPTSPASGTYWLSTLDSPHSLKVWSAEQEEWVDVATCYLKLEATGIGRGFKQYDAVNISGIAAAEGALAPIPQQLADLNGSHVLQDVTNDRIIIIGLLDEVQEGRSCSINRKLPKLDYVCEAQNRLWGCYYGPDGNGNTLNEIYCCALGDFTNWQRYEGLSTDSYAVSCGTDGPWTGAINYLGYPCFFKENRLHKVYISSSGAHQVTDVECRGVQSGCSGSMAIVNGNLYYKNRDGICVYDGSLPQLTGNALGRELYYNAVGGSYGNKYYVSMEDAEEHWNLFVLDTKAGIWMREDSTHAKYMARCGDELYILAADGKILAVNGTAGTKEADISWKAETGIIGYSETGHKSISRFNIRMKLPKGSRMQVFAQYDSDGVWRPCGVINGTGLNTFLLPVRPRRCDHFRLKMEGCGEATVYSFSKIYESGTDAG